MDSTEKRPKKEKTAKNYVKGSAIAAVAAAGLTLGALFASPEDLINKDFLITPPYELSDCILAEDDDGDDVLLDSVEKEEKKQRGIKAALIRLIQRLPFGVKAFAGVPIWIIGRILLTVLGALFHGTLSPALMTALKYLCIAGLIFASIILPVKAAFPEIPLKKLITGKKIAFSAAVTILFGAVGVILQIFWPEARETYESIESSIITVIVGLLGFGIWKIKAERKKQGMTA